MWKHDPELTTGFPSLAKVIGLGKGTEESQSVRPNLRTFSGKIIKEVFFYTKLRRQGSRIAILTFYKETLPERRKPHRKVK